MLRHHQLIQNPEMAVSMLNLAQSLLRELLTPTALELPEPEPEPEPPVPVAVPVAVAVTVVVPVGTDTCRHMGEF
jgi:hypothetical protein